MSYQKKTVKIEFRVTPNQKKQLELLANRKGMLISQYIRYILELDNEAK